MPASAVNRNGLIEIDLEEVYGTTANDTILYVPENSTLRFVLPAGCKILNQSPILFTNYVNDKKFDRKIFREFLRWPPY